MKANILKNLYNSKHEQTLLPTTDINIFNYKKKEQSHICFEEE